jgi:SAM-dependent methyltransferase
MRINRVLRAILLCAAPLGGQTREQVKSHPAPFPPDQQAAVTERPRTGREAERWNQILTAKEPNFNTNPNAFLVEIVKDRKPGAALDVGMGQGRNAIWLARQGWSVTGFDPADQAVALARQTAQRLGLRLKTEINTGERFDFGENRWDLILFCYVGVRETAEKAERALKPQGMVIVEAFHRDATKGRSVGGGVVFDTGELAKLFPNLRVVRYEEPVATADFGQQRVRVVRYCAQKQE